MKKDPLKYPHGYFNFKSIDDIPYDPKCTIKKGSKIRKVKEDKPGGDLHPLGTTGKTVGGFIANDGQECYVVKWDNSTYTLPDADMTLGFVVSWKIEVI